jgi:hypothetical protein
VFIVIAAFGLAVANGVVVAPSGELATKISPQDVKTIQIVDEVMVRAIDSLFVGEKNIYGPYALTGNSEDPMFSSMSVYASAGLTESSDSVGMAYQVTPTSRLADTCAACWTDIIDSIGDGGFKKAISSLPAGNFIWFQIRSEEGAGNILLQKPVRVVFKKSNTFYTTTK